jgi:WD40 repeat protein
MTKPVSYAFSPDMQLFVGTDLEGNLAVWDMRSQALVTNFVAHSGMAVLVRSEFIRNGKSVLTLGWGADPWLKEWDTATWQELHRWPLNADQVFRVVSPGADWIALATEDGWFELIRVRGPEGRRRFKGEDRVRGIDLSPDGRTLAAASENGTVELWDTATATRSALLQGVLLGYHSVAISPDGKRVAAGSNGRDAVKLWDLASREEVATLAGEGSTFTDLKFSPDGNTITARNWAHKTCFWTAPSWEQIEAAEKASEPVLPPSHPTR